MLSVADLLVLLTPAVNLAGTPGWDPGFAVDWRLAVALTVVFLASFAKGVAGLGVPIIATPILTSLYDLRTAILISSLPMLLSDVPFVIRGLPHYREAARLVPFVLLGLPGIVLGAHLLVTVRESLLAAVLGTTVLVFVLTSWFNALPTLSPRLARVAGPLVGFVAGTIQAASGASGPLVTMYLLSIGIPRY